MSPATPRPRGPVLLARRTATPHRWDMLEDTAPAALRKYIEGLRRMTPLERGRVMEMLTRGTRQAAMAGLRLRHPDESERLLKERLVALLYGADVAERLAKHPRFGEG